MKFLWKLLLVLIFFSGFVSLGLANKQQVTNAQTLNCTVTITYTSGPNSGSTVTNNQIITGASFSAQVSVAEPGNYDLVVTGQNVNGAGNSKRFPMNGSNIAVTDNQIYDTNPRPTAGNLLQFQAYIAGTSSGIACSGGGVTYTYVNSASACQGSISLSNNNLSLSATGCSGKRARVTLVRSVQTTNKFSGDINSNTWTNNVTLTTQDRSNYDFAVFYICDSSNQNCTNEVGRTAITASAGCPVFYSWNPPIPIEGSDIQVQYNPLSGASPQDFQVVVSNGGTDSYFDLISAFNKWVASLGTQPLSSEVRLIRRGDSNPATNQCDFRIIGEAGNYAGAGGAGANPCTSAGCPTAVGNLPITLKALAEKVLQIGIGLAGGIALILMVVGAIRILISSGDQQKLNGGREMMIAAIAGLLFLLFATLILQFIGISILRGVPGIGTP